jgi:hypothetical protein
MVPLHWRFLAIVREYPIIISHLTNPIMFAGSALNRSRG